MDIPVYNADGELLEQFPVDEAVLGGKPSRSLVRQAVLTYEAARRVGTARTKRRDEVVRSRRKPWPQKHTGRARHGDRGSPIWVGGGVAHGPRPRKHSLKMNRKARARATQAAFLLKAQDGELIAIDRLELPRPKTKEMARILRNLGVERSFLIVLPEHDATLWRCTRNIPGAAMMASRELNAYEMIRPSRVIFTLGALQQFVASAGGPREDVEEGAGVNADG